MQSFILLPLLALPILAQNTTVAILNDPIVFKDLTDLPSFLAQTAQCTSECYRNEFIGYATASKANCTITGAAGEKVDWACFCKNVWKVDYEGDDAVNDAFALCGSKLSGKCTVEKEKPLEVEETFEDYDDKVEDAFTKYCEDVHNKPKDADNDDDSDDSSSTPGSTAPTQPKTDDKKPTTDTKVADTTKSGAEALTVKGLGFTGFLLAGMFAFFTIGF
ncbi:hypothetical protein BJ508DRAFT_321596 [Ascobolus immersus RN42]|uniref:Extracellular membrane protein CFEM domain-containing protein n=1 Tax=Ascobolus immersus RN42 TaxID=1160509 RepID=A0A3N4IQG6_ASCIM|nr:hypothetical protein BJ508DRAFT_321596 [Ascobolus immersus RN42]